MQIERFSPHNDKYCAKCVYYRPWDGGQMACFYWDDEDELRGCPPGKDCTRRKTSKRSFRGANWKPIHDEYIAGVSITELSKKYNRSPRDILIVSRNERWAEEKTKRIIRENPDMKWNKELAKSMWENGYSISKIADEVKVPTIVISVFAQMEGWNKYVNG